MAIYSWSRLPMAPKHMLVQKRMLASQVYTPICSEATDWWIAGSGTKLGSTRSKTTVPTVLTTAENAKPGRDRSMMYHRTGLARAKVNATWSVDCHGSRRCNMSLAKTIHSLR